MSHSHLSEMQQTRTVNSWDSSGWCVSPSRNWLRAISYMYSGTATFEAASPYAWQAVLIPHIAACTRVNNLPPRRVHTWDFFFSYPELEAAAESGQFTSAGAVEALRRESGLTWQQIAKLFNVSRRAVHGWASGARMNGPNLERLGRILATVRDLSAESPEDMRQQLFSPRPGRPSIYDELRRSVGGSYVVEERVGVRERIAGRDSEKL